MKGEGIIDWGDDSRLVIFIVFWIGIVVFLLSLTMLPCKPYPSCLSSTPPLNFECGEYEYPEKCEIILTQTDCCCKWNESAYFCINSSWYDGNLIFNVYLLENPIYAECSEWTEPVCTNNISYAYCEGSPDGCNERYGIDLYKIYSFDVSTKCKDSEWHKETIIYNKPIWHLTHSTGDCIIDVHWDGTSVEYGCWDMTLKSPFSTLIEDCEIELKVNQEKGFECVEWEDCGECEFNLTGKALCGDGITYYNLSKIPNETTCFLIHDVDVICDKCCTLSKLTCYGSEEECERRYE